MPPMTGRVIAGRYNLQHPIGRGAMGVVWRARDQILDRDVAVKEVLISNLLGEEERRNAYQRTLREARTAARLSHRGLVAVYDVAEDDGRPWIVMELVPSRSLDQVLTVEGRLPAQRVGRIGQQLLSALAAAHLAGVLHRDVKPSNVLIATDRTGTGWDERAVLTDFGIAQFEGDPRLTQTGMVMGSPGFTAPERIRGGDATPASDLWSLGATLYAAVEGRGPYEQRGGAITTMSAIINEDAPIAAHAGRLAQVIAALLRRDPAARPSAPTAARMFAQLLSALAAGEEAPSRAHPPTVISKPTPPSAAPARSGSASPAGPARGSSTEPSKAVPAASAEAAAAEAAATVAPTALENSARALAPRPAQTQTPSPEAPSPDAPAADAAAAGVAAAGVAEAEVAEAGVAEATPEPAEEGEAAPAAGDVEAAVAEPAAGTEASAAGATEAGQPAEETPAVDDEGPAADEAEAAPEATPTPTPTPTPTVGAAADAESAADNADKADDAAAAEAAEEDEPAVEEVSAVDAVSAIEEPQASDDADGGDDSDDDSGVPVAAEPTAEPTETDARQSGQANTVVNEGPTPPAAGSTRPKPKPSPSFTAAKPGERAATPTFSAARQATPTESPAPRPAASSGQRSGHEPAQSQYGAAQYGPAQYESAGSGSAQHGASQYGANQYGGSSYGGPSAAQPGGTAPLPDQPIPYTPGKGGGAAQRRSRPGRRIAVVTGAVLAAVAIGAGAAIALSHKNPPPPPAKTTHHDSTTAFQSVNALNNPSSAVPKGWAAKTVGPIAGKTTGGFTVDLPPGWTVHANGLATDVDGPSDQMFLEIDLTPHKHPNNMVEEAESIEKSALAADKFPGYQRAVLKEVPVRGTKGAFWQFTWERDSAKVRTDDILFVMPTSNQSYAVYIRGLSSAWGTVCLPLFDQILQTFQTIPPST